MIHDFLKQEMKIAEQVKEHIRSRVLQYVKKKVRMIEDRRCQYQLIVVC